MPRLLRTVRQLRWDKQVISNGLTWLEPRQFAADPLADLYTQAGALSLWEVPAPNDLDRVLAALAATRQSLVNIDYLLFDSDVLLPLAVPLQHTSGGTPDDGVNTFHWDLEHISAHKMPEIARLMLETGSTGRRLAKEVKAILQASIEAKQIDVTRVSQSLLDKL